uniref:Uncharacterized protein n=1 Tax=Phlebotomus papatasi TaxID=29031 RepID=A0A1B0D401_PHLPP
MSGEGPSRQNNNDLSGRFGTQMTLQEPPEENMQREIERLKTFSNWPVDGVSKHELATLGLYFLRPPDVVKCAFCEAHLTNWTSNDDVFIKHLLKNKNCPLLTFNASANVPLDPLALDRVLLSASYGFDTTIEETVAPPLPIHSEYELDDARYQTYSNWPSNKKTPDDLCDAGFFYSGNNDEVICFSCGGSVQDWKEDDCIWEIHAARFNDCDYVKFVKGEAFVKGVKEKYFRDNDTTIQQVQQTQYVAGSSRQVNLYSELDRLNTFANWTNTNVDRQKLAMLGFYFTKAPDCVTCVFCGLTVWQWLATDDELIEHLKHSPNCPLLNLPSKSSNKACKICYGRDYNVAFVPCGHVVACKSCASSVKKCPICRECIKSVTRLYFS